MIGFHEAPERGIYYEVGSLAHALMLNKNNASERNSPYIDYIALDHFNALQQRDGWPDEETGQPGHCKNCHGVWLYGSECGHWLGCPKC